MKMVNVMRLLVVSLLFQIFSADAQICGSDYIHTKALENADYSRSFFKLQEVFDSKRKVLVNTPKTIPTIVHILHSGEPYGQFPHISSNIVYEVIDTLNSWYASTNADLEFCLASVGPDGGAINAVQYHDLGVIYAGDASGNPYNYNNAIMNATIIAPSEYLNIYVHDWGGSPSGFANVGYGNNCWVKTSRFSDFESTTLVHETGHWCGLFHTFTKNPAQGNYDDCEDALSESNCELQGDKVCDTPATPADFSCNDACVEIDEVDESWMSYAPDNCQYLFTPGQINRMHGQLESYRQGVINNNIACGGADIDLAIISIENQNPQCDTYFDPLVTVSNLGFEGTFITEITLNITDSVGGLVYSDVFTGALTLDEGETIEVSFSPTTLQYGDYNLTTSIETPGDGWEFNNTIEQELPFQPFTEISIVYYDAFSPTTQWRIYEVNPETGDVIYPTVASCNWGGPQCWETGGFFAEDDWPIEWSYCLQPGCYQLWWRWTSNSNLDCELVDLLGYPDCYVDIQLSNGEQIYYWDEEIDGSTTLYFDFCVEPLNVCPIVECPTDLDGDGLTGNSDLLLFLPEIGQQSECHPTDFNFDGETDINDLTLFLNQYGYGCDGSYYGVNGFIENNIMSIDCVLNLNDAKIIQCEIYDLSGRIMDTKGTLPEGIYIVKQYWDKYGFVTTKKLYISQ